MLEQVATVKPKSMAIPIRVLIVEGQPADAELMTSELRRAGFVPTCTRVDTEAEYVAALGPDFDLILANYTLPRFDALRALDQLVGRGLDIPFIVVTAAVGEEAAVQCLKRGAADYLLKDRMARLGSAVGRALTERALRVDKRQADDALREETRKLHSILDSMAEAVVVADVTGRLVEFNPAAERLHGVGRTEEAPEGWGTRYGIFREDGVTPYPPEDIPLRRAIRGETTDHVSLYVKRSDGTGSPVEATGRPILDAAGAVVGGVVVFADVTERRRAEEALGRREAEFREAQRVAGVGSWECTLKTGEITWSDELYRINRFDPKRPLPQFENLERFYTPESWARLRAAIEDARQNGRSYELDLEQIRTDGTGLWTATRGEVVRDAAGHVVGLRGTVLDITERKQAVDEVRRAAAYNRSLIEASLDPLVTIGSDGRITDVNGATEVVTGRAWTELVGTDFSDYFTAPEQARAGYQQAFREGSVRDYPLELQHRDGHVTSVLYNASVYRDESGRVTGIFAAARDVTERKRAEEALRESEAKFRSTFMTNPDACYLGTLDEGVLLEANSGFERIFGYTREEAVGKTSQELDLWVDYACRNQMIAELRSKGSVTGMEARGRKKNGEIFSGLISTTPLLIGGRPCLMGIVRDITESKRIEQALRASEFRLRRLVESNVVGVFFWSLAGAILDANDAFLDMVGYSREELAAGGVAWDGLTPADFRSVDLRAVEELKVQGVCSSYEKEYVRKDGSRVPVLIGAAVFPDKPDTGVAFTVDISARRNAERELARLNEELEAHVEARTAELRAANAELEAFSYSISHDLRAPLRALQGFSRILIDEHLPQLPTEASHYVGLIRDNAAQMGKLIDDLLAFSRFSRQPVQSETVDVGVLVQQALDQLAPEYENRHVDVRVAELPRCTG